MENLYLIELWNDKEKFYKIGTTVHRYSRFYQLMKFGYKAKIIYMLFGLDCYEAWDAEYNLMLCFPSYTPLTKFGGHRECFSDVPIDEYKKYVAYLTHKAIQKIENLEIVWR